MIPEDSSAPEESHADIDAWLVGLSGKATGKEATYTTREGGMIRKLLVTYSSQPSSLESDHILHSEAHWEKVLQRVRIANSLPKSQPRFPVNHWLKVRIGGLWFWASQSQRVAIASVAVVGLAIALVWRSGAPDEATGDPTIFRGDESKIVLALPAGEVDSKIQNVTAALEKNRVAYLVKPIDRGVQVQAKVMPSHPAIKDLEQLGIAVPQHGRLNLVITAK